MNDLTTTEFPFGQQQTPIDPTAERVNPRLIAAELLKALKGLLAFNPIVSGSKTHKGNFQNWKASAEALIAKAEKYHE